MASVVHGVPVLPRDLIRELARAAPLQDPRLAAGVLGAAGALIVVGGIRSVRRRRRGQPSPTRGRRLFSAVALFALLLVGALLAVNSYAGYVPTMSALRDIISGHQPGTSLSQPQRAAASGLDLASGLGAGGSHIVRLAVGDPALDIPPRPLYVLLPRDYSSPGNVDRRYPVVYLIHGYPGGSADWLRAGRVDRAIALLDARHLLGPMIIAMPDVDGGWLHDSECLNQPGGPQVQTYLSRTVVNAVDTALRTIRAAGARAIGGLSSGAYCSLNVALRHQDVFSTVLASEPFGDPGHNALVGLLHGNLHAYRANSPSSYLPSLRFRHRMAFFLDASRNDPTRRNAIALATILARRDQYVAVRIAPSYGHTWREVQLELPYSLLFADAHLTPADAVATVASATDFEAGATR